LHIIFFGYILLDFWWKIIQEHLFFAAYIHRDLCDICILMCAHLLSH